MNFFCAASIEMCFFSSQPIAADSLIYFFFFALLWCRAIWFFKFTRCANVLSQCPHLILRFGSWVRVCLLRSDELVKPCNKKKCYKNANIRNGLEAWLDSALCVMMPEKRLLPCCMSNKRNSFHLYAIEYELSTQNFGYRFLGRRNIWRGALSYESGKRKAIRIKNPPKTVFVNGIGFLFFLPVNVSDSFRLEQILFCNVRIGMDECWRVAASDRSNWTFA